MSRASRSLNGVLILGPIQAAECFRATRIRFGDGSRIERCFQPRQQRAPVVLGRLRHVGWWHGARVHLAHHFFPDFRFSTGLATSIWSSLRSAVLSFSLWHVTQFRSSIRRTSDAGAGVTGCCAEVFTCTAQKQPDGRSDEPKRHDSRERKRPRHLPPARG